MELRQVRYFLAVEEERHFGRAAERLRIAQSAVSQQMKALERSVGARLFDRTTRPIELTPAGRVFLEHARRIVEGADRAVEEIRSVDPRRGAIVRFGASSFGNGPVVDELLEAARTRLGDIEVQVSFDTTAHNIEALDRRALDATMAYVPYRFEGSPRYLRLGTIEYAFAIPADHPLAAREVISRGALREQPVLFVPRSINPLLAEHVSAQLFGRPDHPWADLSDVGARRIELVAEGAWITPVAYPVERILPVPGVVYRRVEDPAPTLEFGLLWYDDHVSPGLEAFLRLAGEIGDRPQEPLEDRLAAVGA